MSVKDILVTAFEKDASSFETAFSSVMREKVATAVENRFFAAEEYELDESKYEDDEDEDEEDDEEAELNEVSADTLASYMSKANVSRAKAMCSMRKTAGGMDFALHKKRLDKRDAGIKTAVSKYHKKLNDNKINANEEVEELDELSKKTLGSYTKAAANDIGHLQRDITNREPGYKGLQAKRNNRRDGIERAVDRLTKEEAKLDESRQLLAARKSAERAADQKVRVQKDNYNWGKMITVHDGTRKSFPLHPEHQEKIKNLKDGGSTTFTDETRRKVKAQREGDTVHLQHADSDKKTSVAHSHFTEEFHYNKASE